jgi:drug/metabolite transporter (DMT)-like permease
MITLPRKFAIDVTLYIASAMLTAFGLAVLRSNLAEVAPDHLWVNFDWPPLALAGMAIYVAGLGVWVIAMARNPFSIAYPIGISLAMLMTVCLGVLALDEAFLPIHILGVECILAGVYLVGRPSGQ